MMLHHKLEASYIFTLLPDSAWTLVEISDEAYLDPIQLTAESKLIVCQGSRQMTASKRWCQMTQNGEDTSKVSQVLMSDDTKWWGHQ